MYCNAYRQRGTYAPAAMTEFSSLWNGSIIACVSLKNAFNYKLHSRLQLDHDKFSACRLFWIINYRIQSALTDSRASNDDFFREKLKKNKKKIWIFLLKCCQVHWNQILSLCFEWQWPLIEIDHWCGNHETWQMGINQTLHRSCTIIGYSRVKLWECFPFANILFIYHQSDFIDFNAYNLFEFSIFHSWPYTYIFANEWMGIFQSIATWHCWCAIKYMYIWLFDILIDIGGLFFTLKWRFFLTICCEEKKWFDLSNDFNCGMKSKKNAKMKSKQLCVCVSMVEISKTCIFKSTTNNTEHVNHWENTNIIFEYTSCCHWHKHLCGSSE